MKIRILGTAASEGIPAMYCDCNLCRKALETGGKNIRTRQQALVDDLLIDFGPDTYAHFLKAGKTLAGTGHILITHSHGDHLSFDNFYNRGKGFAYNCAYSKVRVYASRDVCRKIRDTVAEKELAESFELVEVSCYSPFVAGEHIVTAFPAAHMQTEQSLIYLVELNGKSVLYCLDTGVLTDDTMYDYLKKESKKLDMVVFDCTKGDTRQDYYTHMCREENEVMKQKFERCSVADSHTLYVCTHFSHNCKMTHEELVCAAKKYGFTVAYDGYEKEL